MGLLKRHPLSDSTRKYRSTVIGVASALIAVQTFHVRITEIPVAGKSASASTASRAPRPRRSRVAPPKGPDGGDMKVICVFGKPEYFCNGGWTGKSVICPPVRSNGPSGNRSQGWVASRASRSTHHAC